MEEDRESIEADHGEDAAPSRPSPQAPARRRPWWLIPLALAVIGIWTAVGLIVATRTATQDDVQKFNVSSRDKELVLFDFEYGILLTGYNSSIELVVAVPKTIDRRHEVLEITYDPQPVDIFDKGENRYAEFLFIEPEGDITVNISGKVELYGYDLTSAREMDTPEIQDDLDRYLESELYLEKDSAEIQAAADDIDGSDRTDIVEGLFDYVVDNIRYTGYNPGEVGAEKALLNGGGDCSEYSDILVALCRARGIPAKTTDGFIVEETLQGRDLSTIKHSWVEIYLEEYGWVPFDPTLTDSGLATFERLDPVFLRVSDIRNDGILENGHFWSYHYWGDPIEVIESYIFTPL
jgi:transglutaminase-like putative cysteine protease